MLNDRAHSVEREARLDNRQRSLWPGVLPSYRAAYDASTNRDDIVDLTSIPGDNSPSSNATKGAGRGRDGAGGVGGSACRVAAGALRTENHRADESWVMGRLSQASCVCFFREGGGMGSRVFFGDGRCGSVSYRSAESGALAKQCDVLRVYTE